MNATVKKQQQIEKYLSEPLRIGDDVYVRGLGIQNKNQWGNITPVKEVHNDYIITDSGKVMNDDWKKYLGDIGENHFSKSTDKIRSINFQLESIMFGLGLTKEKDNKYDVKGITVKNVNFNPYIFNPEKHYYQRPLVWKLEDKQNLIESIYNDIDCGKILIRNRGWKELENLVDAGETDLAWKDVVDGKQRLHTMYEYVNNEFSDIRGNYFGDLSDQAQNRLLNHQLFSYSELPENSLDQDVLNQFLKLNFAGVPQSIEHIEFVKSLIK